MNNIACEHCGKVYKVKSGKPTCWYYKHMDKCPRKPVIIAVADENIINDDEPVIADEPEMCCICYEKFADDVFVTDCNHKFHHHCISQWISQCRERSCPCCRKRIIIGPTNKTINDEIDEFNNRIRDIYQNIANAIVINDIMSPLVIAKARQLCVEINIKIRQWLKEEFNGEDDLRKMRKLSSDSKDVFNYMASTSAMLFRRTIG